MSKYLLQPLLILLLLLSSPVVTLAETLNVPNFIHQLGQESSWDAVIMAAQDIVNDSQNGENSGLAFNSSGVKGQKNFDEITLTCEFSVITPTVKLAILSDDGVTVDIEDLTTGEKQNGVLNRKGTGQPLPNISKSLQQINASFQAGHKYCLKVHYLNTYYTGAGDVDGAVGFSYGGELGEGEIVFEETSPFWFIPINIWNRFQENCSCDNSCTLPNQVSVPQNQLSTNPLIPVPDDLSIIQPQSEPLGKAYEEIKNITSGDSKIVVVKNKDTGKYIIMHYEWVAGHTLFVSGVFELTQVKIISKQDWDEFYDAGQLNRDILLSSIHGGSGYVARTGENIGTAGLVIAAFAIPGPEDAVLAVVFSKYALKVTSTGIEKLVDGVWVKLAGKDLDEATVLVKKEIESAKEISVTTKGAPAPRSFKKAWDVNRYADWFNGMKPIPETSQEAWAVYQRKHCGNNKYNISKDGCFKPYEVDGINGVTILESKHVGIPSSSSMYVPSSSAPQFLKDKAKSEFLSAIERGTAIAKSCETPITKMEIFTNNHETKAWIESLIPECSKDIVSVLFKD